VSAGRVIHAERHRLEAMLKGLHHSERLIRNEKEKLSSRRRIINGFDPRNVLKRGYSITYHDGRPLKSFEGLSEGDDLRTILHKGELISSVRKIKKKGGGI
jgi:exodeoxyribonuclease VII large subunit